MAGRGRRKNEVYGVPISTWVAFCAWLFTAGFAYATMLGDIKGLSKDVDKLAEKVTLLYEKYK